MSLELDTRQRAMLQEMGVQVWLPETGVAILQPVAATAQLARPAAAGQGASGVASLPAHAVAPAVPVPMAAQPVAAKGAAPAADRATNRHGQPAVSALPPVAFGAVAPLAAAASQDWATLSEAVRNCQVCASCSGRSHATLLPPPESQAQCDWMVVGDPPDEDEDRAGAPFAGQDAVLLDNMLRALGLQRANVLPGSAAARGTESTAARRAYVSNVLKCRPAHGAMPQAAELAQCAGFLQQEIALVQPKMILALGRFANQLLLGETPALAAQPLGKLRGTVHRYQGVPVVVSYPPKLLMRNSADKAKAWADLCLAAATLD
jgi:DNA polymerase